MTPAMPDLPLPLGTSLHGLSSRHDPGGTEIQLHARAGNGDGGAGPGPVALNLVQWNLVQSEPNTLRGVHVHIRHWDYLHVALGAMTLGLHDMRPWSATHGLSALLRLSGDTPAAIAIPPGVAHGFYFAGAAHYLYAVSEYWSPSDELGCRWDDPALRLDWPAVDPALSQRDRAAAGYRGLVDDLADAHRRGLFAT